MSIFWISSKRFSCDTLESGDIVDSSTMKSPSFEVSSFAVAGVEIKKPILPDFALYYDKVPLIPYYCPSSINLAVKVGECFEKNDVALLRNHGIVIGDTSLKQAFYKLEMLRAYTETFFGAEVLGGAKAISKKGVTEIKDLYRK